MESSLDKIRDQQKASWNKFSSGWKKWDAWTMEFLKPMGDEIIRLLKIKETDQILDVATGTGEPGQTIAKLAPAGRVTGYDISDGMLGIARENAALKGVSNYETVLGEGNTFTFPDNHFDAVCCRMGFMFFPDMKLTLREMYRVLKPGGRLAISVWGIAPKNPWVTIMMGTIGRHIELDPPPPGAPGMFRCAAPGLMTGLLKEAGFRNGSESEINGKATFNSAEAYWTNMTEVGAPIVAALSKADEATKTVIRNEVFDLLKQHTENGEVKLDYSSLVICGEK